MLPELPVEELPAAEARFGCDLLDRQLGRHEQFRGVLDSQVLDKLGKALPGRPLDDPRDIAVSEMEFIRKFFESYCP